MLSRHRNSVELPEIEEVGFGATAWKNSRASPTDNKVGLDCIFCPWTAQKLDALLSRSKKEYRRSSCGRDAVQYVGGYSESLGYAITFAAIAAGNGNCNGSSDASSDPIQSGAASVLKKGRESFFPRSIGRITWIHRVHAEKT